MGLIPDLSPGEDGPDFFQRPNIYQGIPLTPMMSPYFPGTRFRYSLKSTNFNGLVSGGHKCLTSGSPKIHRY